ncbi:TetR/AcrR family transcriptional regulator [Pseudonocardia sulfidoxydans]|uniref:TetR/AcrR family transcriptional regulator n=1 Tax=Pseudonocardia sulfidoxydans TaxID=54011 RepID=UPI00361530F7
MTGRHDARDRALDATVELLLERGWTGTTPAAVAERAGAGKMSLYRHFTGKDELVAAALAQFSATQRRWLLGPDGDPPRDRLLGAFTRIGDRVRSGKLAVGCPFVATRLQSPDKDGPAAMQVLAHKNSVAAEFTRLLQQLGHPDAAATGEALLLLLDGAIVHAAMSGSDRPVLVAARAAATLIDAHTLSATDQ